MRRADLRRLLRGQVKHAVQEVLGVLAADVRLEDTEGRVLVGASDAVGPRHPVVVDGTEMGAVVGERSEEIARVVGALVAVELEKRGLAQETLGRYKELTLLYDMSEQFSKLLDPEAVAQHAVDQAQRHLRAAGARLMLFDPARQALRPMASVGAGELPVIPLSEGDGGDICARVFVTGHAELVEDGGRHRMCAPLRHGESVFGVLQAEGPVSWNAGDLKLVCAMAANVASALHKAQLHADQVRAMALRHQMQRHTSPDLLEAVFDGDCTEHEVRLAVLFSDLRAASADGGDESPSALLERIDAALTTSLAVLMQHGAVVDVPLGEMLVAVFWNPGSFEQAARNAVASAAALRSTGVGARLGIGVASGTLGEDRSESLDATINAAARLHTDAAGTVLVDPGVQSVVQGDFRLVPHGSSLPQSPVYEVVA